MRARGGFGRVVGSMHLRISCLNEPTSSSDGSSLAPWEALSNALEGASVLRSPGDPARLLHEHWGGNVRHAEMTVPLRGQFIPFGPSVLPPTHFLIEAARAASISRMTCFVASAAVDFHASVGR